MARTPHSPFPFPPKRMYWGAHIPRRVIRRYARAIAEEFHPDKIILFGSYAYGTPDAAALAARPALSLRFCRGHALSRQVGPQAAGAGCAPLGRSGPCGGAFPV